MLVYEQYTFAKNSKSKNRVTWTCSSRCSQKCNAQVTLSHAGVFGVINSEHTHPPPVFYVNKQGEYIRMTKKQLSQIQDEDEVNCPVNEGQDYTID